MSINFNQPVNEEASEFLKAMLDEIPVNDGKTFLIGYMPTINQESMKELANKAGQPVIVELNKEGDIKTMSDGTQSSC